MENFDTTGLIAFAAIGAFIAVAFAAVDKLLLKRQAHFLSERSIGWWLALDNMSIDDVPGLASKIGWKTSLVLAPMGVLLGLLPTISLIQRERMPWEEQYFEYGYVFQIVLSSLFFIALAYSICSFAIYRSPRGAQLFLQACVSCIGLWISLVLIPQIERTFIVELVVEPVAYGFVAYSTVVAAVFGSYGLFAIFRYFTCHLLEVSIERGTILGAIGVAAGAATALAKLIVEFIKLLPEG